MEKKKRFTFIDVVIIVVIIAAVIVGFRLLKKKVNTKPTTHVTYTVLVINENPTVAESVVPEDNVLLDSNENMYGKVTDVVVTPNEGAYLDMKNGKYVVQETDERKDIYLTVEADAVKNDWGYDLGKQHIRVGEKQTVSAAGYGLIGYIISIEDDTEGNGD